MASLSVIFAAIPAIIYLAAGLPFTAGAMTIGTPNVTDSRALAV